LIAYNSAQTRITDNSNRPVAGGLAFFFLSGTTTLTTVYADEDGVTPLTNPVAANAFGVLPTIFYDPATLIRSIWTDADGDYTSPIWVSPDPLNLPNPALTPVDTVSATAYVVLASDNGRIKKRTAAADMSDTLPTAVSVGNGFQVTLWNATLYSDTVQVSGAGTINGSLFFGISPGQRITFISDGSTWNAAIAPRTIGLSLFPFIAGALIPPTTNPAIYALIETATNDVAYDSWVFADGATQLYMNFTAQMPASWNGGAFDAEVEWEPVAGVVAQTITWGAQAACLADGEVIDRAYGSASEQADAVVALAAYHKTARFTVTPANGGAGRWIQGRVYRKASTGTLVGGARLLGIRLLPNLIQSTDA
jgi:hypothetical protein